MKLIADTATLFSPAEGREMGVTIIPVCVSINDKSYKDYEEISSEEFLELINEGGVPTSSQPSVGEVLEVFETCKEETLFITLGDGLSGAYQTAIGARNCIENNEHIHIVNSKTLAGPLRYIVHKASVLKEKGVSCADIISAISESIESSVSFVIPEDFEFLKRSGRLTAITAKVGGVLKLLPVMTQTEDKTRIKPLSVKRSWNAAVEAIIHRMQDIGVSKDYLISVCHAGTYEKAVGVLKQIKDFFPFSDTEILTLSPGLMTHGGPGCIVVQAVKK